MKTQRQTITARCSVNICSEKHSCPEDKTPAVLYCKQCRSYQCDQCFKALHKGEHHTADRIPPVAPELLCTEEVCKASRFPNLADFRCESCDLNLCVTCDDTRHKVNALRKQHPRSNFYDYLKSKNCKHPSDSEGSDIGLYSLSDSVANPQSLEFLSCTFSPSSSDSSYRNSDLSSPLSPSVDTYSPIPITAQPTRDTSSGPLDTAKFKETAASRQEMPEMSTTRQSVSSSSQSSTARDSTRQSPLVKGVCTAPSLRQSSPGVSNDTAKGGPPQQQHTPKDATKPPQEHNGDYQSSSLKELAFHFIDQEEKCTVDSAEEFAAKIGCDVSDEVKVISIFGNTGDGKSHTLNHTFFGGRQLFPTSPDPSSCTAGVWAAFEPEKKYIILDTEGLLGLTGNTNQRTRLLLKVLACSDVVIYRTKAERLHNDMFNFLGDASLAYADHFHTELTRISDQYNLGPLPKLGPAVVIFHETHNTNPLPSEPNIYTRELLGRFESQGLSVTSFSKLVYSGIRTNPGKSTSFSSLRKVIDHLTANCDIRRRRPVSFVLSGMTGLNSRFSGDISDAGPPAFPEQYFTCSGVCRACSQRCRLSVGHDREGMEHQGEGEVCPKYVTELDNKIYLCKACHRQGRHEVVVHKVSEKLDNALSATFKFVWTGYVLECSTCGVIFRSRQYWTGNPNPEDVAVIVQYRHLWPGEPSNLQGTHNAAQRVVDGVTSISGLVSEYSSRPTKMILNLVNDNVAPDYWQPNSEIHECAVCHTVFALSDTKHHCRDCGFGVCIDCSQNKMPVPHRGWGETPVKVCQTCYDQADRMASTFQDVPVSARKVTEAVAGAAGVFSSVISYPKEMVKSVARPQYWQPDHLIKECSVCKTAFGPRLSKHHCRACGQGVCGDCSPELHPVPLRGWDTPVRVCKTCVSGGHLATLQDPQKLIKSSSREQGAGERRSSRMRSSVSQPNVKSKTRP